MIQIKRKYGLEFTNIKRQQDLDSLYKTYLRVVLGEYRQLRCTTHETHKKSGETLKTPIIFTLALSLAVTFNACSDNQSLNEAENSITKQDSCK